MQRTTHADQAPAGSGAGTALVGMSVIRLGDWDIEPSLNLLRCGAEDVRLEPKVMEVLVFLIRRAGEVVSREALLRAVWQGVVVGDDALTQVVIKLRKALGDDARAPRYIETVAKRGYRLVAPVHMGDTARDARPPARTMTQPLAVGVTASRARVWTWSLMAALVIGSSLVLRVTLHRDDALPKRHAADWNSIATATVDPAATRQVDDRPVVAVMPFEVLGDHPEQRYLARGLAAELAADLARLSGLDVVAAEAAPGIGGEGVHAAFRVFGAVQRTGDQMAAEVRLVDGATGGELWSERYYRPFGDLFAIRDEVESQVATALARRLGRARLERDAGRYNRSVGAYDAFLRAKAALLLRTEDANDAAKDLYHEAIRLDAAFARAYGGLALIYAGDYLNQRAEDGEAALARALEMAKAAVQIDPQLPEAHWVLGYVSAQQRRHEEAIAHLDDALAVSPGFADAHALKGGIKTYLGEPRASIPLLRTAMRLKPTGGYLYYLLLGRAEYFLGEDEQARVNLREAIARNPANLEAHIYLAAALLDSGDADGAEWEAEEIRTLAPDFAIRAWLNAYPMTDARQIERLADALGALKL